MSIDAVGRIRVGLAAAALMIGLAVLSTPVVAQDRNGGIDRLLPRQEAPERGPQLPDGGTSEQDADTEAAPGSEGEEDGSEQQRGQADAGSGEPVPQSPLDLVMKDGIPKHAAKRAILRDDLYALLATAGSAAEAKKISRQLQRVWAESGSDTAAVLLARAARAFKAKNNQLALELLDAVVELKPDHAEAWNRRAYVHYRMNNYTAAVGDLRRALALDENHFKALDGLASIFQQMGDDAKALSVYEKLQGVHPFWPGLDKALSTLRDKVEGRGI